MLLDVERRRPLHERVCAVENEGSSIENEDSSMENEDSSMPACSLSETFMEIKLWWVLRVCLQPMLFEAK